jgi:hypothetical protein
MVGAHLAERYGFGAQKGKFDSNSQFNGVSVLAGLFSEQSTV